MTAQRSESKWMPPAPYTGPALPGGSDIPTAQITRGIYIYQFSENLWNWQVIVGGQVREGQETTYARARLRADNALAKLR